MLIISYYFSVVIFSFFYVRNCLFLYFYFFFQAEDGIRDLTVTGVQTCALPISLSVRCSAVAAVARCVSASPSSCASPSISARRSSGPPAAAPARNTAPFARRDRKSVV